MKRSATTVAVLLLALVAGCGTRAAGPTRSKLPDLGAVPTITEVQQVVRPIDAYLPTPAQTDRVERAAYLTSVRCLKRFGVAEPSGIAPPPSDPAGRAVRSQLYGYFAPRAAPLAGYDSAVVPQRTTPLPDDALELLTGRDKGGAAVTQYHGRPVAKGGCWQEGLDAVGGAALLAGDPAGMPGGGPPEPLKDPRVIDADQQWSACMKSRGFSYGTPADAYMDPRWRAPGTAGRTPTHSAAEIKTATADMSCKRSTNFMGVVVAVESAYDREYIAANSARLAALKKGVANHLATVAEIIAAGHTA
ncbi:hypothetical protein [Streptomyces sp. NBC_00083]|uniref:hypothetical protein n=1 Tax=Streptomyces sp. NBC_00083 TaxID=2975647 RepID=UPI00225AF4A1|nr:hypothetical protein [Streptomyces sp. NBC_00083]MCX5386828.1 hypothetical protein [Streptomyces sp. NBC_00083]